MQRKELTDQQLRQRRSDKRWGWISAGIGLLLLAAVFIAAIVNPDDKGKVFLLPTLVLIVWGYYLVGRKPR